MVQSEQSVQECSVSWHEDKCQLRLFKLQCKQQLGSMAVCNCGVCADRRVVHTGYAASRRGSAAIVKSFFFLVSSIPFIQKAKQNCSFVRLFLLWYMAEAEWQTRQIAVTLVRTQ